MEYSSKFRECPYRDSFNHITYELVPHKRNYYFIPFTKASMIADVPYYRCLGCRTVFLSYGTHNILALALGTNGLTTKVLNASPKLTFDELLKCYTEAMED